MPSYQCKRCNLPAVKNGYCEKHSHTMQYVDRVKLASYQKNRPGRKNKRKEYALNNDLKWNMLAVRYLASNPFCVRCKMSTKPLRFAKTKMAVHVDHIKPVEKFPELKYTESNLQSLCLSCHSKKSALEKRGQYYDYEKGICYSGAI